MSLLQNMPNHLNIGRGHVRSHSYNEILSLFKTYSSCIRKRPYSDCSDLEDATNSHKRSRTAPPTHSSRSHSWSIKRKSRSLSPTRDLQPKREPLKESTPKPKLPSISDALNGVPIEGAQRSYKLRPITPTVSLDYFDTYKPNDENWRYELLDSINRGSKHFNLNQYNYLTRKSYKPNFNSKISSKIKKPTLIPRVKAHERKINFPFESNYTYLNKTYLNDVEKFPEYLELAHSLIQLSKPRYDNDRPPLSTPAPYTPISSYNTNLMTPVTEFKHSYYSYQGLPSPIQKHEHSTNNACLPRNDTSDEEYRQDTEESRRSSVYSPPPVLETKFVPITPPSSKKRSDSYKSPKATVRVCLSCGSDQSPCWRPSWSIKDGQLCNSCGLRYKKTSARCLNMDCKKIPAKGEWSLMQSKGKTTFDDGSEGFSCLDCGSQVEVSK